jgi:hypothetical protein
MFGLMYLTVGLLICLMLTFYYRGSLQTMKFNIPIYNNLAEARALEIGYETIEIGIQNLRFINSAEDDLVIIKKKTNVKWVNKDPLVTVNGKQGLMPHVVQVTDFNKKPLVASSILSQEHDTFSYTFGMSGKYYYGCMIHPFMKGEVVVVDDTA